MRILLAIYKYFPWGGLQKDTLRVIQEAVHRGHAVTVLTTAWDGARPQGDVTLEFVKPRGFTNHTRMRHFGDAFLERLRGDDYDVSYAMNRIPGADFYFAADTCMKRCLREKHSALTLALLPRYRAILKQEYSVVNPRYGTTLFYITPDQLRDFTAAYGIHPSRMKYLPPGMDPTCGRPDNAAQIRLEVRATLGISDDALVFILVGTNIHRKGVDRAIAAVASLPDSLRVKSKLLVIGNNPVDEIHEMARAYGIDANVFPLGARDDVSRLLLASDLMMHPAREEGTGTVIIEAIASGVPVICTGICGFANFPREATQTVLQKPYDQQQFNQLLLDVIPRLPALKIATIQYAATQDFHGRSRVTIDYLEAFAKRHPRLTDHVVTELIRLHREQLQAGTALKKSPKRNVTRVEWNGHSYIVKEYCNESFFLHHAETAMENIAQLDGFTPRCRAFRKLDAHTTVLIFDDAGDGNFFSAESMATEDYLALIPACGRLLGELHNHGFYHGDAKTTNYIVNRHCDDQIPYPVTIVDCDNVRHYARIPYSKRVKNIAQFLAGSCNWPEARWLDDLRAFLHAYGETTGWTENGLKLLYRDALKLARAGKVESFLETTGKALPETLL